MSVCVIPCVKVKLMNLPRVISSPVKWQSRSTRSAVRKGAEFAAGAPHRSVVGNARQPPVASRERDREDTGNTTVAHVTWVLLPEL